MADKYEAVIPATFKFETIIKGHLPNSHEQFDWQIDGNPQDVGDNYLHEDSTTFEYTFEEPGKYYVEFITYERVYHKPEDEEILEANAWDGVEITVKALPEEVK